MANFAWLVDELGNITGNRPDANLRLRYLREAGIIGKSTKDRLAPQVETVQATSSLLANLIVRPQVDAPSDVRKLWRLKLVIVQPIYTNHEGATVQLLGEPRSGLFGFGQTVMHLLERAVCPDEFDRAFFNRNNSVNITVHRNCDWAEIAYDDRIEWYFQNKDWSPPENGQTKTRSTADAATIARLAQLVQHSRDEAARLNTTTPTDEAWKGLGFTPPLPGPPYYPLTEWNEAEQAAFDFFKTKAAGLPPPAASTEATDPLGRSKRSPSDYQSENEQTVEVSIEQSIPRRRPVQRRGDAPVGRNLQSPARARMPTDDERPDGQHLDDGADTIAA
ncbi:MAG: hypothetical protein ACRYHQ_22855 [Janthinobacterium lividum]